MYLCFYFFFSDEEVIREAIHAAENKAKKSVSEKVYYT